jgi:hypothetical protein
MQIKNTQPGPRGVNTIAGPVVINPGETATVEVYAREKEHMDASGWFEIEGDYTADPGSTAARPVSGAGSDELEALKAQLAERDAEIVKLKASASSPDRDDLKKQADELGLQYPGNISNVKLKELIDAKLAA